jgi:glycosyltransferase involved in cell wall biosynthesis
VRFLFFKESFAWPRAKGHDVHCYYMMHALARIGHEVSLLTLRTPASAALAGLDLKRCRSLQDPAWQRNGRNGSGLKGFQERFRSYWGIEPGHIHTLGQMAGETRADAVVVVGLSVLPYLAQVKNALRVWYAADEWAWHHLSQVSLLEKSSWENLGEAVSKGLYERAYAPLLDRVWVVSETDRRAMRWVAGARAVDVIPNGVDGDHYRPHEQAEVDQSCVFWGRLDFGPNIQALTWFCRQVWPALRQQVPGAKFTIYGFNPIASIQKLHGCDGIQIVPDLPDLRPEIGRHQVVVLPFVSGGGIKNKLLEAASMGKAIVCSRRACGGLRATRRSPLVLASTVPEWVNAVQTLWQDAEKRRLLGQRARAWVLDKHGWMEAAREAVCGLERSRGRTSA